MERDYEQICAEYKEKEKNCSIEELENLIEGVDKELEILKDRHECLEAQKRAYKYLIEQKQ